MTLAEWIEQNPHVHVTRFNNGAVTVYPESIEPHVTWPLWRLADYVVSSAVSGPGYLLIKRQAVSP